MENTINILIVEDELIAAESLALDLKKLGYHISGIVNSGEKAITKVTQSPPHLILMDIMLKGDKDGITTAEEIYHRWKLPIIYLSAYADIQTLQRAKSTPVYGYLVKPYKIADVSTTITMALAKYQEDKQQEEKLVTERKLNEIKTRALATASHDLRTPLTSILGYTELIRDYGDRISPEKKEKYFDIIKSAVGNMKDSLEDLLLISKAEEGKITIYPQEFNLVKYLQMTVEEYQNISENHDIKLLTHDSCCNVSLDQKILNHILHNLLSNAVKYSPLGGEIKVILTGDEEKINLKIEDEGIGIPQDYYDKLFSLFERGSNVGTIKGNGLGLSIVKKAVDLHQGDIQVISKGENQGCQFSVTLPRYYNNPS